MKSRWLYPVVLVLAAACAYVNSLHGPFFFDDFKAIPENGSIRTLWPLSVPLHPPPFQATVGRPLANLTLAINYAVGGLDVRGYHVFNIAIHVLAGLVLFGIVARTLRTPALDPRFGLHAQPLAFAVALLWLLHPLQTEPVTYVSTRTELLMGLFYLLTLYCAIRGATSSSPGRAGAWYAAAVSACALGAESKEVIITAPVIVFLYDRIFLAQSWGEAARRRWPLYVGLCATWIIIAYNVASTAEGRFRGEILERLSIWDNLKTQTGVLTHYLRLALWPAGLCVDYYDWPIARHLAEAFLPGLLIVALLSLTAVALWQWPPLGFLGAWFFVILSPTNSFYPMPVEIAAERRMYLPLAAIIALLVIGAWELARRLRLQDSPGRPPRARLVAATALAILAVGLAYLTMQRNADYQSEDSIWRATLAQRPNNLRARNNLAVALAQTGRKEEAEQQFMEVIARRPDYAAAYNNLGNLLKDKGDLDDAVRAYAKAIELLPSYADARINLGLLLGRFGDVAGATRQFAEALRHDPQNPEAHNDLALALTMQGQAREALPHFDAALRLRPDSLETLNSLAWLLATHPDAELRDPRRAIELAERARKLSHDRQPQPLDTLGAALAQAGRFDEAERAARQALALTRSEGNQSLAAAIARRIELYARRQPYVQGTARTTTTKSAPNSVP